MRRREDLPAESRVAGAATTTRLFTNAHLTATVTAHDVTWQI